MDGLRGDEEVWSLEFRGLELSGPPKGRHTPSGIINTKGRDGPCPPYGEENNPSTMAQLYGVYGFCRAHKDLAAQVGRGSMNARGIVCWTPMADPIYSYTTGLVTFRAAFKNEYVALICLEIVSAA